MLSLKKMKKNFESKVCSKIQTTVISQVKNSKKNQINTKKILDYDIVVNALKRRANFSFLGNLNLEMSEDLNHVKGNFEGFMEQSNLENIFIAGDILENSPGNEPAAAISGKRVARIVKARLENDEKKLKKLKEFNFDFMPYCLFTDPEIVGTGFNEEEAVSKFGMENLKIITLKKLGYSEKIKKVNSLELLEGTEEKFTTSIYKIISKKENGKILGMHCMDFGSSDIMQGYSVNKIFSLKFFSL